MWLPLEYLSIKVPLPAAEHQGLPVWHQLDMKLLLIGLLHPDIIAKPVGSFASEIAQQRQDILRTVVSHTLAKFSLNLEPSPDRYEALINTAYREYNEAAMGKGKRTAEESRKKNC